MLYHSQLAIKGGDLKHRKTTKLFQNILYSMAEVNESFGYYVRNAKRSEIGTICIWRNEQFGYRANGQYLTILFDCDPLGWFVAVDTKTDRIIGLIAGLKIAENVMFAGLWAVEERYRRLGIGRTLWQKSISRLQDQVLALNAIESRFIFYTNLGLHPSFKMTKYSGHVDKVRLNTSTEQFHDHIDEEVNCNFDIIELTDDYLKMKFIDKVIAYDAEIETTNRCIFMTQLILHMNGCKTYIALSKLNDIDIDIIGYGMLRPLSKGYNVGPIFANNNLVAHKILSRMLQFLALETNFIEILLPQPIETFEIENGNNIFASLKNYLQIDATFYRMYNKDYVYNLPLSKVYAITGTESFLL